MVESVSVFCRYCCCFVFADSQCQVHDHAEKDTWMCAGMHSPLLEPVFLTQITRHVLYYFLFSHTLTPTAINTQCP